MQTKRQLETLKILLLPALFFLVNPVTKAEQISDDLQDKQKILLVLNQPTQDLATLSSVLYQTKKYIDDPQIKTALITALEQQSKNAKFNVDVDSGEANGEYYSDLVDAVLAIETDTQVIAPLINTFGIIGGVAVPKALAAYGDQVVPSISERYNHLYESSDAEDGNVRHYLLLTAKFVLSNNKKKYMQFSLSKENLLTIKRMLLKGLKDNSPFSRGKAIAALEILADPSTIPILQQLAETDTYAQYKIVNKQRVQYFPIVEQAQAAIKKLAALSNDANH